MATPNRLPEIAKERGQTVPEMIADIIQEGGSVLGASRIIRVSPWTISRWIKHNGFAVDPTKAAKLVPADKKQAAT